MGTGWVVLPCKRPPRKRPCPGRRVSCSKCRCPEGQVGAVLRALLPCDPGTEPPRPVAPGPGHKEGSLAGGPGRGGRAPSPGTGTGGHCAQLISKTGSRGPSPGDLDLSPWAPAGRTLPRLPEGSGAPSAGTAGPALPSTRPGRLGCSSPRREPGKRRDSRAPVAASPRDLLPGGPLRVTNSCGGRRGV